jgi:hypothetical protein
LFLLEVVENAISQNVWVYTQLAAAGAKETNRGLQHRESKHGAPRSLRAAVEANQTNPHRPNKIQGQFGDLNANTKQVWRFHRGSHP